MNPLNILQTCFSRSWGGLEIQALEVSTQLIRRGHHVRLAVCPGSRLQTEAERRRIPTIPVGVTGYFHPLAVARLSRMLRAEHTHIIHAQHSRDIATLVPAMQLSRRRIPIILSKRVGSYLSKKDLLHRYTYRHVTRVLAISEVIRRNVIATTPARPETVMTLHDAVDTHIFTPDNTAGTAVRREFHIDDTDVLVGFVGRFSPGKGHEDLLRAAAMIRTQHPRTRFLIVGEASFGEQAYEKEIRDLASSLDLGDTVTFAGFRSDVPAVMAAFDILAFPSHAESFGVVLIEAMAMGKPVVATNCDGVIDIVVDGETGIMVPPKEPGQLAAGLAALIADPGKRQRMGSAGRRRVEEHFDQERQITRLEALYAELFA